MDQKKKKAKRIEAKNGSALLLATILLFVVLSLVISMSYVTVMEQKMSSKTKSSVGAFFNADSGIEWALNQIANAADPGSTTVQSKFNLASDGSKACPFVGCIIYFLKADGTIITQTEASSLYVSDIKAVRSVGTQTAGDPTQRAIEAAVAAGDCERTRSSTFDDDAVFYCSSSYPKLYSCSAVDDEASSSIIPSTDSGCSSNGLCSSSGKRANLGPDAFYFETVVSSGVQGCWAYEDSNSHAEFKIEIMCCDE